MTNEDKLRQIREEAEEARAPESLSPEAVRRMLEKDGDQVRARYGDDPDVPEMKKTGPGGKKVLSFVLPLAAAALVFVLAGLPLLEGALRKEQAAPAEAVLEEASADMRDAETEEAPAGEAPAEEAEAFSEEESGPSESLLAFLEPAPDYAAIYERFHDNRAAYVLEESEEAAAQDALVPAYGIPAEKEAASESGYSVTNQRDEEVAESDFVQTDGSFIYSCQGGEGVRIIRAEEGSLIKAAWIPAEEEGQIRELYVQGERLVLVEQVFQTGLAEAGEDVYRLDRGIETRVLTYDISDPEKPLLLGTLAAEGSYYSSRIREGFLYLLTQSDAMMNAAWNGAFIEDYKEEAFLARGILPRVGGEVLAAEDIYLPSRLYSQPTLLITSMDLEEPDKAADAKAVLAWSSQIYVSRSAIYLETIDWKDGTEYTSVIRIDYGKGRISPSAAMSVRGSLIDSFSIDESGDGFLRLAVTDWSGEQTDNAVYVYDASLRRVGALTGLAGGETIRSCRFMGDLCFLVTFRNTDPLFTLDLSDPAEPLVKGELTLPGYSEYLHPWKGDLLLGLGRDADPETGAVRDLKLSLFDISDPAAVREKQTMILEGASWSPAEDSYRALLAGPDRGLIGFALYGTGPDGQEKAFYQVFSCGEAGMKSLALLPLADPEIGQARGLYIGDFFYLAESGRLSSYTMDTFEKKGELAW